MRIAVTGAYGFLGWHLSCRLAATQGVQPIRLGRDDFADPSTLAAKLATVDTMIHLAGVNRAESDDEVETGNIRLAKALVRSCDGRDLHVVYANSIQADLDSPYGRGKRAACEILANWAGTFADVRLPNLFGEHGRPGYNSFVATFCHEVAAGRQPTVTADKEVPLLHAQAAAQVLMDAGQRRRSELLRPAAEPRLVSDVLELVMGFRELYAERGEVPNISTPFRRDMFNTLRSYLFPWQFPIHPVVHGDQRGELFETARSHGGTGQAFVSTTRPGETRGNHYHLNKVERFFVVKGDAEIRLRRLHHAEVVAFQVSGDKPGFVDMPTMWVHDIRNIGDQELVTMFWADQLLDPQSPDQYPENVEVTA